VKSSECFATSKRPRRIPRGSFGDVCSLSPMLTWKILGG
jgi:hypothetical protein